MLTDAWLFASTFTVNKKKTRKKKTTMTANEEAVRGNNHTDAKSQPTLLRESNRTAKQIHTN